MSAPKPARCRDCGNPCHHKGKRCRACYKSRFQPQVGLDPDTDEELERLMAPQWETLPPCEYELDAASDHRIPILKCPVRRNGHFMLESVRMT